MEGPHLAEPGRFSQHITVSGLKNNRRSRQTGIAPKQSVGDRHRPEAAGRPHCGPS